MRRSCRCALFVGLVAVACGGEKKDKHAQDGSAGTGGAHTEAPNASVDVTPLALGVARPSDFTYEWGKGARAFAPALAALEREDWTGARSACEEAVARDPGHLDAHRLLASALAQQGEYEKAIEHLKIALAGDWVRWGGSVESDPDLEPLLSSTLGPGFKEMVAAHRAEFGRSVRTGLLVVARRGPFKEPARARKPGASSRMASRAEVFAYVKETQRYLRLTRTGFHVLGFLRSPSGDEIAYVNASHVTLGAAGTPAPPVLAQVQVGTVSLASPEAVAPAAGFRNARAIAVEYLAGDELVVTTYDPLGPWGLGEAHPFSIDRADGKARPTRAPGTGSETGSEDGAGAGAGPTREPAGGPRLVVRYETADLETAGDVDGIAADWNPENGSAAEFVIDASKKRVQLPAGEAALRSSMTWSPDRTRLAFATAADPCAADIVDRQAALYLVESESGKLKHLFKGTPRFHPQFLDGATLAFEDGEGGVRLHDAAVAREVGRLDPRGGIALHGLGAAPAIPCPAVETAPANAPQTGAPGAPPAAPRPTAAPPGAAPAGSSPPAPLPIRPTGAAKSSGE